MPIYAYRCEGCGFQKDALQKLSDPPLTDCPQCGEPKLAKQLTAAGFALKGTGWYVTDFRNQGSGKPDAKKPDAAKPDAPASDSTKADSPSAAASTAAPAATPAAASSSISAPAAAASQSASAPSGAA